MSRAPKRIWWMCSACCVNQKPCTLLVYHGEGPLHCPFTTTRDAVWKRVPEKGGER
jgi:hypothetical protein